jgi:hypothetical protein
MVVSAILPGFAVLRDVFPENAMTPFLEAWGNIHTFTLSLLIELFVVFRNAYSQRCYYLPHWMNRKMQEKVGKTVERTRSLDEAADADFRNFNDNC